MEPEGWGAGRGARGSPDEFDDPLVTLTIQEVVPLEEVPGRVVADEGLHEVGLHTDRVGAQLHPHGPRVRHPGAYVLGQEGDRHGVLLGQRWQRPYRAERLQLWISLLVLGHGRWPIHRAT